MSRQKPPSAKISMSSSFEKSVKGGTKIKLAAPKSKYVEHILRATHAGDAGVAEVFRTLTHRLRDSTWTIVFKGLIIVHLMIREGEPNVTLKFISDSPSKLAISNFSDVQDQGSNVRHYYHYILSRAKAYKDTKLDWVREGQGRLKKQTIDKGLLREAEAVQKQIAALLRCDLLSTEVENEITLTAFRLLTMDLLILYHVMNEGTINVLEHYFEMSRVDAERALSIYKIFSRQTNEVVEFLSVARRYENATRLEIPKLKHAPTSLTASLEEYLNDPDFEINRRQYLAQQDAKKGGQSAINGKKQPLDDFKRLDISKESSSSKSFPEPKHTQSSTAPQSLKGPAPDLIDFFESIEQNQQPMAAVPQQQISSFQPVPQYQYPQSMFSTQPNFAGQNQVPATFQGQNSLGDANNPFAQLASQQPLQTAFTGMGPNTFSQQIQSPSQQPFNSALPSIPQTQNPPFLPQQQAFFTAPQQPMVTVQQQSATAGQRQPFPSNQQHQQQQSTNPFRHSIISDPSTSSPFSSTPPLTSPQNRQSTNPFARSLNAQSTGQSPFTSPPPQPQPNSTTSPFFSNSIATQQPQSATQFQLPQSAPLQQTGTGTNPFARSAPQSLSQTPIASPLVANPTGSTNPFRQSMFVNQQTGQGWQANQGTMGGLEQLETIPVFPRPGQPSFQPQGQHQNPWR